MFDLNSKPAFPEYVDTKRLWKRGEIAKVCTRAALAEKGPLDTRELALRVIRSLQ